MAMQCIKQVLEGWTWQWTALTLKSDLHLQVISPYNITPVSHIKVMRIKKMINSQRSNLIVQ